MSEQDIKLLIKGEIKDEIRAHEIRVGFVSGVIGGVILTSLYGWLYVLTFQ